MADFIDTLLQLYPDDSKELKEQIKSLKRNLEDDEETVSKVKKAKHALICDICAQTFTQKNNYTRHVLSHKSFFECRFCDRKFKREDNLKRHIRVKHNQTGGQINNNNSPTHVNNSVIIPPQDHGYVASLPPNQTSHGSSPPRDHGYAKSAPSNQTSHESSPPQDHGYAKSTSLNQTHNDHNYAQHRASTQTALNRSVQDYKIEPDHNERYDMLTFFANIRSRVEDILKSRLSQHGIKWYLSVQLELVKDTPEQATASPHFRSRAYATLNLATFEQHDLNESFQKMFESFEKYVRDSSGWVLKQVVSLTIHTVIYKPLSGSSFIDIPKGLIHSRSLLNIRNLDQKCFLWSCLAFLHPMDSPLVSDYEPYEHELNMEGISYPVSIKQINTFEKRNPSISVNVFTYEDKDIIPMRITRQNGRTNHINLLLLQSENNSHYVLIQNLNCFLSSQRNSKKSYHYCHYCLHGFTNETLLAEHMPYCQVHGEQKIELPSSKDCFLEFKDFEKTLRVPYVIYADFETLNKPIDQPKSATITRTQLLEPCSFGYKIVSTDPGFSKDTVVYRGADTSKKLLENLFREAHDIEQRLQQIKPLALTHEEENAFQAANRCCLCQKLFLDKDTKARHHDHTSGIYLGAAHMNCNLQCKQVNFIPVIFHNLKNFDAHLLCQNIGSFKHYRLKCIPQTMEKYVSFSIGKLRFIDSLGFLPSSLDSLVDNLSQNGLQAFSHFQNEIKEHTNLLLRKGVYPYQYCSDWQVFTESQLPSQDAFYSSIKQESISNEEYQHAKRVFDICGCKHLGDYHDLYLKTDVLLLADVFENFRSMSLKCYELDPCHFYTSPGLSWQAMLKMTGVTLELMTDIDQILFIEKGIRGGISQISNRYKKANNPYLDDYDPSKETSYLAYYDVNNLYGFSMSEKLPTGFFTFLTPEEIESFHVQSLPEDGSKGYILEVDLEYPEHLHDSHNDYPLAPVHQFVPDEKLSPYAQKVWKKLHNAAKVPPRRAKVEKLLTTLEDKEHYVLHYRNLQLYLQLGLKLKKIHRVLEFQQEAFMKPYVEFNTKMRQQAKSTFEKNFFKLMNNSVFGKTMENLRKHRSVELCHTEQRLKKLSAKSTYKCHRIFSEDLVGVELNRLKVKLNRPIYIGMSVLDLSKTVMYDFYYNHLKKLYGDKLQLHMTDTDSFLFSCETQNLFQDMYEYLHLYDTSDFPNDHFLHSNTNRKVMGRMKKEMSDKCISEFAATRSKSYAFCCENEETKKSKGISRTVVSKHLTFQDYKDTLFNESAMKSEMSVLRSHDHQIFCERINKISLSCFDDKRFLLHDGIHSLAYGHYKIQ